VNKKLSIALVGLLTLVLLTGSAFSAHRIEILRAATINGVELKPGKYELSVADEKTAEIYKGKKLIVSADVEVQPLGGATAGSVAQGVDGKIREIRLKNEKVVFVNAATGKKSGR